MWKLIVIHPTKYVIQESNELDTRGWFNILPYSSTALFGFLYDDKQRLVETFIRGAK